MDSPDMEIDDETYDEPEELMELPVKKDNLDKSKTVDLVSNKLPIIYFPIIVIYLMSSTLHVLHDIQFVKHPVE